MSEEVVFSVSTCVLQISVFMTEYRAHSKDSMQMTCKGYAMNTLKPDINKKNFTKSPDCLNPKICYTVGGKNK